MEKHTPGPWTGSKTSSNQGLVYPENDGSNVAVVYDVRDLDLIAAAPDLLEACQKMLTQFISADIIFNKDDDIAMGKARAAMSKAEGN